MQDSLVIVIDVSASHEIGKLADAFNNMSKDLGESQNKLVEAERLAAVQTFNERKVNQLQSLNELALLITKESSVSSLISTTPKIVKEITSCEMGCRCPSRRRSQWR